MNICCYFFSFYLILPFVHNINFIYNNTFICFNNNIKYADDIELIAYTEKKLQKVVKESNIKGLTINYQDDKIYDCQQEDHLNLRVMIWRCQNQAAKKN